MSGSHIMSPLQITNKRHLVDIFASGEKPKTEWRIGTEHEKFGFCIDDLRPPAYAGERGIEALLMGLTQFGWLPLREKDSLIGLTRDGASVTLEPAGQLELSGKPLANIHQTSAEIQNHLLEVRAVAQSLGLGFLGMGFQPKWSREQMPWMPKGRYAIMRRYMPTVGSLGLDMMTRTCTVQVNLDYSDETDMVEKFRVSMALQPIVTALFADSPFCEGRLNGYQSYRAHVWTKTDPDRTGLLDFVYEPGFGYERYVDYLLTVPMYCVYRHGTYHDLAGQRFIDLIQGSIAALPGEVATEQDWLDHMTTAFPEVRLKRFLEMRGADAGSLDRLCALSALWVGLLYDATALAAATDLVQEWTHEMRHQVYRDVPRQGLQCPVNRRTARDVARDMLSIAREGLQRRAQYNAAHQDESHYLEVLDAIVESGITAAQQKINLFHTSWQGQVDPIFTHFAF